MTQVEFEKLVDDFSDAAFASQNCETKSIRNARRRQYIEARQALIAAFAARGWQPIENAPKDMKCAIINDKRRDWCQGYKDKSSGVWLAQNDDLFGLYPLTATHYFNMPDMEEEK